MSPGGGEQPLPSGRVTLLLTDVEGSTAAWDADPIDMDAQMERHDAFVMATVEAHGGQLLKSKGEGDSTFSVFAQPHDAVAAALEVIRGLRTADFHLPVRAAVHIGDVIPRGGDYFGPVPNRAARLRGLASGGQVLLSSSVVAAIGARVPERAAVVALGLHQLRGLAEPEEVYGLAHPDLPEVEPLVVVRPPSNLPAPVDAFVGRDDDRTALEKALGLHRLVTIVGPGGVGKTRLVLEIAADQAHALPGGTWFVDVGALTSPEQIGAALVTAVGAELEPGSDPVAVVANALRGRAMLVLDTCEAHLDASAEFVDQLLHNCSNLSILATTREALGVRGEAVLRLEPLSVGGVVVGRDDQPSDAARLFLLRAGAADLSSRASLDLSVVEQVCAALDGIPLAIELAAAQVGVLDLTELAEQLASAVGVEEGGAKRRSGPERHRTVRAAVQWSLQRATPDERELLTRLTTFVGGWPRGAPEAVCADDQLSATAISQAHAGLVRRSLVVAAPDTGAGLRHRLLDMVRTIAAEDLAPERIAALRTEFVAWCMAKATELDDAASAGTLPDWLAHFAAEMPNLRAAIAHAVAIDRVAAAQTIAAATTNAWQAVGAFADATSALDAALDADNTRADGAQRARALAASAMIELRTGNEGKAQLRSDEAVSIVRGPRRDELPDLLRAEVFSIAIMCAEHDGDTERLRGLIAEQVEAARRSGDRMTLAIALNNMAVSRHPSEHFERLRLLEEAAELEADTGVSIMARLQLAKALGLGGWSARALAQVDRLERSDLGVYLNFELERARAEIELQLAMNEEAAASARSAIARAEAVGIGRGEIDECTLALGRALHRLGQCDDALATLRSIRSDEWVRQAAIRAVEVLVTMGRLDEAEARFADVPETDDATRSHAAALIELARGRASEALAIVTPKRAQLAEFGLSYFEARLLDLEISALTELGRLDEAEVCQRRLAELQERAHSA